MLQLLNIVNQMGIPIISSAIMKLKLRESYMKYAASVLLFTVDDMSLSVGRNNKPLSYKFQFTEFHTQSKASDRSRGPKDVV